MKAEYRLLSGTIYDSRLLASFVSPRHWIDAVARRKRFLAVSPEKLRFAVPLAALDRMNLLQIIALNKAKTLHQCGCFIEIVVKPGRTTKEPSWLSEPKMAAFLGSSERMQIVELSSLQGKYQEKLSEIWGKVLKEGVDEELLNFHNTCLNYVLAASHTGSNSILVGQNEADSLETWLRLQADDSTITPLYLPEIWLFSDSQILVDDDENAVYTKILESAQRFRTLRSYADNLIALAIALNNTDVYGFLSQCAFLDEADLRPSIQELARHICVCMEVWKS